MHYYFIFATSAFKCAVYPISGKALLTRLGNGMKLYFISGCDNEHEKKYIDFYLLK